MRREEYSTSRSLGALEEAIRAEAREKGAAIRRARKIPQDQAEQEGSIVGPWRRQDAASSVPRVINDSQCWRRRSMETHKFSVGEIVEIIPRRIRQAAAGSYEIIRLLPMSDTGGEPHYRIKSSSEPHERVIPESELTLSAKATSTFF
jgi:hypothetical protein